MQAAATVAVRTRHQARPGRRAVVTDLASLRGPVRGTVELPLRLFWSSSDRSFDLEQRSARASGCSRRSRARSPGPTTALAS